MKNFILLSFFFLSLGAKAQTIIQMEKYEGVYKVPCVVNGAKMKFIFDTGASTVCLSLSMAEYLFDNGFINENDFIGSGSSSVADGRIVDHVKLNIKDIQIGDLHIKNVEAVVIEGQNAPLLLGQSAIQKLGNFEINGNVLIIKNGSVNTMGKTIKELRERLEFLLNERRYDDSFEVYEELYNMGELSDKELYDYGSSLFIQDQKEKSLQIIKSIRNPQALVNNKIDIYRLFAYVYGGLGKFSDAINNYKLSNEKMGYQLDELAFNYEGIADTYYFQESYEKAYEWYEKTLDLHKQIFGIDREHLMRSAYNKLKKGQKSYRSDTIDRIIVRFIICSERIGNFDFNTLWGHMTQLADVNNKAAQKFVNEIKQNALY